jgi:hypothetical protein
VNFIGHGLSMTPGITQSHKGGVPTNTTSQSEGEKGKEESKVALGIAAQIAELIGSYGLRLGEVIAGGLLILFGLVTLTKGNGGGGTKVVPLPV